MAGNDNENQVSKYYANIMLGVIALGIGYIVNTQSKLNEEQIRQKTIQEIQSAEIKDLKTSVLALERDNVKGLQDWVEKYFTRKPQE